jgi:uncharacterized membrane protein YfcA
MLYFGLILSGLIAGTWGSLIGAGGGFILVPLLLFVFPDAKPATVTAISLVAVLTTGISATVAYIRLKRIDFKLGIILGLASIPTAILGVMAVVSLSRTAFQAIFAGLLIVLAAYLIFIRRKYMNNPERAPRGSTPRELTDKSGTTYKYKANFKLGGAITLFTGFLSAMLGIGGGLLNVPALILILQIPVHVATATSQLALAATSGTAVTTHAIRGTLLSGEWIYALLCGVGTVVGAQIGPRISGRLSGVWIVRFLALGLAALGARLLWNVF